MGRRFPHRTYMDTVSAMWTLVLLQTVKFQGLNMTCEDAFILVSGGPIPHMCSCSLLLVVA